MRGRKCVSYSVACVEYVLIFFVEQEVKAIRSLNEFFEATGTGFMKDVLGMTGVDLGNKRRKSVAPTGMGRDGALLFLAFVRRGATDRLYSKWTADVRGFGGGGRVQESLPPAVPVGRYPVRCARNEADEVRFAGPIEASGGDSQRYGFPRRMRRGAAA